MKKVLFAVLLGIGLMMPSFQANAIGHVTHKIIDCNMEEQVGIITSQESDGTLVRITITDNFKHVVLQTDCSGYYWQVDLSGLAKGVYTCNVTATHATYSEVFTHY